MKNASAKFQFKQKNALLFLFIFLELLILFFYSRVSWFWTDEGNTVKNVLGFSWLRIIQGDVAEGNTSPFYYLILKLVLLVCERVNFEGFEVDILRFFIGIVPTVIFITSALYRIIKIENNRFWVFWCSSLFFIAINSTHFFIVYSWQARQYSWWVCFTWLFILSLEAFIKNRGKEKLLLIAPIFYSLLLVFTMPISTLFVFIGALTVIFFYPSNYLKRLQVSMLFFPSVCLGIFYVLKVPPQKYQWVDLWSSILLVLAHAKYWLLIPFFALLIFKGSRLKERFGLLIFLLFSLSSALLLANLYMRNSELGYEISNRYFVFMLPVSVFLFIYSIFRFKEGYRFNYTYIYFFLIGLLGIVRWSQASHYFMQSDFRSQLVTEQINKIKLVSGQQNCFCLEPISQEIDVDGWGELLVRLNSINKNCNLYKGISVSQQKGLRVSVLTVGPRSYMHVNSEFSCALLR
ncbi:MAG: hypothetical protein M9962_05955 [Oligoflexia bacterium]|nr:hypothetical protein [Oligoflexia bacterium]